MVVEVLISALDIGMMRGNLEKRRAEAWFLGLTVGGSIEGASRSQVQRKENGILVVCVYPRYLLGSLELTETPNP
jgi:hypothetical protein